MSAVRLPRHTAWLTFMAALALGAAAFFLVMPRLAEPLPPATGERIAVPWHTTTRLTVVHLEWTAPDIAEITTRRDSKTGTTFTRRLIDCRARTFELLGHGRTEAEARAGHASEVVRHPVMENSIPFYVAAWACCRRDRRFCPAGTSRP